MKDANLRMLALMCAVVALLPCGCKKSQAKRGGKITVAMVPKIIGIDYFNACEKGAKEAADELGVELIYDGPDSNRVDAQIEKVDNFITRGVDVIAVAPNDPVAISPVLKKARQRGIHVITWDADANPDRSQREAFVNQATDNAVAMALMAEMNKHAGAKAKVVIITGSLTAANQNAWIRAMKMNKALTYPGMTFVGDPHPSEEDQNLAFKVTQDVLKANPNVQGIFGMTSVALPGAAEAVKQMNKSDKVVVTGLSTPNSMRSYVKDGTVKSFVLWNPVDLGYLTVCVAKDLVEGRFDPHGQQADGRRLGQVQVRKRGEIVLGDPVVFTKDNIDNYDF